MKNIKRIQCGDCGAGLNKPHKSGCDVARCMVTGMQKIQCGGGNQRWGDHPGERCGTDYWTGYWPGEVECFIYGWYSYFGPPWIDCGPDHPEAVASLNRLVMECKWNKELQMWEKR